MVSIVRCVNFKKSPRVTSTHLCQRSFNCIIYDVCCFSAASFYLHDVTIYPPTTSNKSADILSSADKAAITTSYDDVNETDVNVSSLTSTVSIATSPTVGFVMEDKTWWEKTKDCKIFMMMMIIMIMIILLHARLLLYL